MSTGHLEQLPEAIIAVVAEARRAKELEKARDEAIARAQKAEQTCSEYAEGVVERNREVGHARQERNRALEEVGALAQRLQTAIDERDAIAKVHATCDAVLIGIERERDEAKEKLGGWADMARDNSNKLAGAERDAAFWKSAYGKLEKDRSDVRAERDALKKALDAIKPIATSEFARDVALAEAVDRAERAEKLLEHWHSEAGKAWNERNDLRRKLDALLPAAAVADALATFIETLKGRVP